MMSGRRFSFRRRSGPSTSATESAWCPVGTESEIDVVVEADAGPAADTAYDATEMVSFSRRCCKFDIVVTCIEFFACNVFLGH